MTARCADWHVAVSLVRAVYERHSTGCCFHVVLDDYNLDRDCIDWTIAQAREHGHAECVALADVMEGMSTTQVGKLAKAWQQAEQESANRKADTERRDYFETLREEEGE